MQAMPNNPLIKTEENEEKNPSKTNTLGPKTSSKARNKILSIRSKFNLFIY